MICPGCGSEIAARECLIGTMGPLRHYRCRCCGIMFNRNTDPGHKAAVKAERAASAALQGRWDEDAKKQKRKMEVK